MHRLLEAPMVPAHPTDASGATLAVVGAGYVGLVTGACLAKLGHRVACHDADPKRLTPIQEGRAPFHEAGLDEVIRAAVATDRLRPASTLKDALTAAGFCFIAVGTPSGPDGSADLSAIWTVVQALRDAPRGMVVVLRSTVPPGTGDEAARRLAAMGRGDLAVVNAPEFLAEGTAVRDFLAPDRLVFGGPRAQAQAVADLFAAVRPEAPRVLTTRPSAELAKYAANAFLAARVSLVNEIANVAQVTGGDVRDVGRIVGLDSRIGAKFLRPGIGYGGSCFPKDVQALAALGARLGLELPVVQAVERTNAAQADRCVATLVRAVQGAPIGQVAIWGIAFKPGTDDARMAPSTRIALDLRKQGIRVTMHDPMAKLATAAVTGGVQQADDPLQCAQGADALLVATEWPDYIALEPAPVAASMRGRYVLDGRNCLDHAAWRKAGLHIQGIGIPEATP